MHREEKTAEAQPERLLVGKAEKHHTAVTAPWANDAMILFVACEKTFRANAGNLHGTQGEILDTPRNERTILLQY